MGKRWTQKEGQWPEVMKSAAHQYEDKLLEFAYGELPQHEADAVDAHVRGCTRCAHSLSEIRGVRATMARLPMENAPDAGLESLLAYAEQAAKRSAEIKAPPSIWKRFLMPLASVMALATVGVIAFRANQEFDTSRASAAADTKVEERAEKEQAQLAQNEKKPEQPQAVAPIVAAASPQEVPATKEAELQGKADGKNQLDDLGEAGGKRGDVWAPEPKSSAPQSITRRANKTKSVAPTGNADEYRQDYSNAAARGALAKDSAPPPPPPAQQKQEPVQDKLGYGLGTSGGSTGGLNTFNGPGTGSSPPAAAKPPPVMKEPVKEESKKRAKAEEEDRSTAQAPAPVAAPTPTPAAPPSYAQAEAPKKVSKGSYGLKPLSSSTSSLGTESDDAALEKTDSLGVDRDAKFSERRRSELRTQSLESARVASNRGDRLSEIRLLAQVLQNGASGYERVEALKRICDAYEALGEPDRADPFCDQLLSEFPNTAAAKAVEDRRKRVQRAPAPAKNAAPDRERKAVDEAASPKPADAPAATTY